MHNETTLDDNERSKLVVLRAAIWGIAGSFFGIVFLSALMVLRHVEPALWHVPAAAAVAGSVIAAFYSVKRVGVMGGLVGSLTALGLFIGSPQLPSVWAVVGGCVAVGLLAGLPISRWYERRRGALLVAITGAGSGALIGWLCVATALLLPAAGRAGLLTLVMVPTVGIMFSYLIFRSGERWSDPFPHWLGISLVAAGVAAVVGIGFWIFAMSINTGVELGLRDEVRAMMVDIPEAMFGGAVGGAIGGALLEMLNVRWAGRL